MTTNLKIKMYEDQIDPYFNNSGYSYSFIGSELDDRTKESIRICKEKGDATHEITYDPNSLSVIFNKNEFECEVFFEQFHQESYSVLLDATTLGTVELAIAIKTLYQDECCKTLDVLYIEPGEYTTTGTSNSNPGTSYNLSEEISGYVGIPGLSHQIDEADNNRYIFFVGFEAVRLTRAFDEQNVNKELSCIVFGVPAFKTNWESNSFINNIRAIGDNNLKDRIFFAPADNPQASFDILNDESKRSDSERLVIAPIGTKPHAIGACVFIAANDNLSSLLYDHPIKKQARSAGVGKKHLYRVKD